MAGWSGAGFMSQLLWELDKGTYHLPAGAVANCQPVVQGASCISSRVLSRLHVRVWLGHVTDKP